MAPDPSVRVGEQVRRGDGPVGIVGGEQLGDELEAARSHRLDHPFVRGLGTSPFEPGDRRLRGAEAIGELALGEAGTPPCLPDQVSTSHGNNIADTLYQRPVSRPY